MKTLSSLKKPKQSARPVTSPVKIDVPAVLSEPTFTAFEAAEKLGVGVETVWRWIRLEKIRAGGARGHRMIPASEVARVKVHGV